MTDSPLLALAIGNPLTAEDARRIADQMVRATHQAMVADLAVYDDPDTTRTPGPHWDQDYRNATWAAVDLLGLYLAPPDQGGKRGPYWLHRAAAKCPPGNRCEVLHEAAVYVRMAERAEAAQHRPDLHARTRLPAMPPF